VSPEQLEEFKKEAVPPPFRGDPQIRIASGIIKRGNDKGYLNGSFDGKIIYRILQI
jgi:hypothetical protein